MAFSNALIFGLNEYTSEIDKNISSHYKHVYIFELAKDVENGFDLSDNWDDLNKQVDINDSVAFCILEDMAENIFLTISLRDTFKDLVIVALSQDKESSDKLKLAGASRVLLTTQTTANVIVEMLEKPIVTEVLQGILYEKSLLQMAQIKIGKKSSFTGKHPADIDWSSTHGIIVIFIVHDDMSIDFIYSSKAKQHQIKSGDIFVVVGYEKDIKEFEKLVGADE